MSELIRKVVKDEIVDMLLKEITSGDEHLSLLVKKLVENKRPQFTFDFGSDKEVFRVTLECGEALDTLTNSVYYTSVTIYGGSNRGKCFIALTGNEVEVMRKRYLTKDIKSFEEEILRLLDVLYED